MSARRRFAAAALAIVVAAVGALAVIDRPATGSAIEVDPGPVVESPRFASAQEQFAWTMRTLEDALRSEERDAAWAEPLEAKLRQLPTTAKAAGLSSVEPACGATMCRVVVAFREAPRSGLGRLLLVPELSSGGFHGVDPDDPEKLRLYVARSGTNLQEHPHLERALAAR
jgi:hypothetical protein